MGRFSPGFVPAREEGFTTELARLLAFRRQQALDDARLEGLEEDREFRREQFEAQQTDRAHGNQLRKAELALRGIRQFDEPPTRLQTVERPDVARGMGLGLQTGEPGGTTALAQMLGAARGEGVERGRPIALPGQFVPELGGFVDDAIFDPADVRRRAGASPDLNPDATRIGLQRRPTREVPDERFRRLTGEADEGGFFFDLQNNPAALEATREARERTLLAEALDDLISGKPSGLALARALEGGVPGSAIDDFFGPEEPDEGFTRDELEAAGVGENLLGAALRDPILARRLIEEANEPEEPEGRGEQFFKDLRRELELRSEFRPAGGTGDRGDPAFDERRRIIARAFDVTGGPTTKIRQAAIDELARGKSKAEILDRMRELNFPPEEVAAIDRFLSDATLLMLGLLRREEGGR